MDISGSIYPDQVSLAAVVTPEWQTSFGSALKAVDRRVDFYDNADALTQAYGSWSADLVVLDLALASPALAKRLQNQGPRLLAFGDPDNAGLALAANLVDFIVDAPSEADLRTAIDAALASAPVAGAYRVHDLSDRTIARLGSLGAEAARVAQALARLDAPVIPPPLDLGRLRAMLRVRRERDRFFPAGLFGEPAWDMLLDLAAAGVEERDVGVSSLCIAAAVPTTTALRWIKTMCDAGLFERRDDPHDARRAFISLSDGAAAGMARYMAATTSLRA